MNRMDDLTKRALTKVLPEKPRHGVDQSHINAATPVAHRLSVHHQLRQRHRLQVQFPGTSRSDRSSPTILSIRSSSALFGPSRRRRSASRTRLRFPGVPLRCVLMMFFFATPGPALSRRSCQLLMPPIRTMNGGGGGTATPARMPHRDGSGAAKGILPRRFRASAPSTPHRALFLQRAHRYHPASTPGWIPRVPGRD